MNNLKNINIYEKNILDHQDVDVVTSYDKCEDCLEYMSSFSSCKLKVSINTQTHIIENATMDECSDDIYIKGMMKAFSNLIIGLPILEANDHGVLRLENRLRDNTMFPVQGVIMPTNSCELFEIPLNIIRDIYSQYSNTQKYNPLGNAYSPKEIKEWKELNVTEREKIVADKIDFFCKEHNIKDYKATLIGDVRVEFVTEKEDTLAKLLFDLETNISRELGFSLEVMFTEKQDSNAKRKN